ncbi:MAG: hypothetical protein JWP63_5619 [Candidatus Solibacter sp.]|nr:hypothetical protein [Candidatus Solibacter sp.]
MSNPAGTPLPAEQAWFTFDKWKSTGTEIGVMFHGASGSVTTMGTITNARMGRLQLNSATSEVSFRLKDANFTHGPVQMFPRWPMPPMVEVIAVQAWFPNGDWLGLAERLRPESLT